MKTFKLHFGHPIKGTADLSCYKQRIRKRIPLDTKDKNVLEISLDGLPKGRWDLLLEWEFDGKDFLHREELDIV